MRSAVLCVKPVRGVAAETPASSFYVLLGPDYAGKSTVLGELARIRPQWPLLSADGEFPGAGEELLAVLRHGLVRHALPGLGAVYSHDFVVSLLQTAVVHLRDRLLDNHSGQPAVLDSYYYKLLAKCRLLTGAADRMVGWWRELPRPDAVFFLDVDPEVAWARSGAGARVHRLEHHGGQPTRKSFVDYQRALRAAMLAEVGDVPVHLLDPDRRPRDVARQLCEVVEA